MIICVVPASSDGNGHLRIKCKEQTISYMRKIILALAVAALVLPQSCKKKTPVIDVASVSVTPASLTLTEGDSQRLSATVLPPDATDPTVTWSSSNVQVATVTSGTVTAVKPGNATITASAGAQKGSCSLTVVAKVINVSGLSLDVTSKSLEEGESFSLSATVTPVTATDKSVIWTSSNTAVATVDQSGKVTAVKAGSATIIAKTADGGKSATCVVTVIARVASVSLNKGEITLDEGESQTLVATVSPDNATDKSVSWTSSDTAVATVDQNGKVTAVKAGSATITVKTTDGGKTATCAVTVIARVASVSLNKGNITLNIGETATLVATVSPDNATDKSVSWTSSDPAVATVDQNGKVTAVKAGNATITVKSTDGDKTATCAVTVNAASGGTEDYGNGGSYGDDNF